MLDGSVELILLCCMLGFWALGGIGALIFQKMDSFSSYISHAGALTGSVFGVITAVLVLLFKKSLHVQLWSVTPTLTFGFSLDVLSAFFLFIISIVSLVVSIYSPQYVQKYRGLKNLSLLGIGFNLFLLSMVGVVLADNAFTFLVMWETMSLVSFFLVIFEHEQFEVRQSGILYVIMTHLGTGFIIVAFLLLFLQSGSLDFATIHLYQDQLSVSTKHLVFVFALIGFGTKAGLVPIHIWLPRAHPVAPTHISTLMSAVMIKTALYGMIRVV